ncbi:MAG: PAS domain-containing sensor histidine kinase [Magnetovibrio sp.]|nr:PAS domain-containing sensor histidine kinase [Magnetovibrio sp.]
MKTQVDKSPMEPSPDTYAEISAELAASEDRFFKIFEASPAMMAITKLVDSKIFAVNEACLETLGFARENVIGKTALELGIWPSIEDRKRCIDAIHSNNGKLHNYELQLKTFAGETLTFTANCDEITYDSENSILWVFNDVTDLKKSEAKLERNVSERTSELNKQAEQTLQAQRDLFASEMRLTELNTMLQTVLDTIPMRIFWKDKDSVILGSNKLFATDAGVDNPDQVIGKTDYELSWHDRADEYRASDVEIMESGIPKLGFEEKFKDSDGNDVWLKKSKAPLRNAEGDVIGVLGIYEDVTHNKTAEVALEKAKHQAESANLAKSQFLSSMSHELRTPLNAILGFAQFLESDPKKPMDADQLESLGHIKTGGNHLLALINEILELAKIESGHMTLDIEPLDVVELFYETLPLVQSQAEKANVTLSPPALHNDCPNILVDLKSTKQVLLNLLTNAVKYNVDGGSVTVQASHDGEYVTISVTDTGIGMSEEGLENLFTPFSRLGQENTNIEGTGIGLIITQDLVNLMKGEIGVESELDKGTTFWVRFPVAPEV